MGTPVPPNRPCPDACPHCWGPGKTFGDGDTPFYISMSLHDLEPGNSYDPDHDQLVLTPHLLEQIGMCSWRIKDGIFTWGWKFTHDETHVGVTRILDGHPVFEHTSATLCNSFVINHIVQPVNTVYMFGYALFHWMDAGLNL